MLKKLSRQSVVSCCLAAALACGVIGGYRAFAGDDDKMARSGMSGGMMSDDMMKQEMMKMKEGMKDDASRMALEKEIAETMVEMHMAMDMCKDGKCEMMMKNDPDMMKMTDDAKAMAMDPDKMKMMQQQIMNDPAMMHQVMIDAMAHTMMMMDMSGKMDGGKMDSGKMDGDKMK
jgi:hypothetical protein